MSHRPRRPRPPAFSLPLLAAAVAGAALAAGCQQQYREPPASDNPATLVGRDGTYVNEVDSARVRSAEVVNEAGGNLVTVTPGQRRIQAYTLAKGARAAGLWRFTFNFEPGRTYELSPSSDTTLSLQVKDQATGKVVNVN